MRGIKTLKEVTMLLKGAFKRASLRKKEILNCITFFISDCGHLTGSDVKLMRQCGRILQAVALATGI